MERLVIHDRAFNCGSSKGDTRYVPFVGKNGEVGYEAHMNGKVEYLYFNPSDNPAGDDEPNVFVYHGSEGDPAVDEPYRHYVLFDEEPHVQ